MFLRVEGNFQKKNYTQQKLLRKIEEVPSVFNFWKKSLHKLLLTKEKSCAT